MSKLFKIGICFILVLSCILNISYEKGLCKAYEYQNYSYKDIPELKALIEEEQQRKDNAHAIAELAREHDDESTDEIVALAQERWWDAYNSQQEYRKILENLENKWEEKQTEYPVATRVWEKLQEAGYSDYVCAGILGNIMAECGGQTLDLKPFIYKDGYYGMCAWSTKYFRGVRGKTIDEQIDLLIETIESQFEPFGEKNLNKFLETSDCKEAARLFAVCYERCESSSYRVRKANAVTAYNYFMS